MVSKSLFTCNISRPGIQLYIAITITRVKDLDKVDNSKLKLLIQYLKGTHDLRLILGECNKNIIEWYIDAAHKVNNDMRGHRGVKYQK